MEAAAEVIGEVEVFAYDHRHGDEEWIGVRRADAATSYLSGGMRLRTKDGETVWRITNFAFVCAPIDRETAARQDLIAVERIRGTAGLTAGMRLDLLAAES